MTRRLFLLTPLAAQTKTFQWPNGKTAALSLTFDDARVSQVDAGIPFLNKLETKATFYVLSSAYTQRLEAWKAALKAGHEIAHHTKTHACTGNYAFAKNKALEDFTLTRMAEDLDNTQSYVPLIAKRFVTGRGYLDEAANDPTICDLSALMGSGLDNLTFPQMKAQLDAAIKDHRWLIFAGHEMGLTNRNQMTNLDALAELIAYARAQNVWLDTVHNIAQHVHKSRA
jgi:peptidoglycan/xylan/chitin deacetylase (PgdA/CDA1 family)